MAIRWIFLTTHDRHAVCTDSNEQAADSVLEPVALSHMAVEDMSISVVHTWTAWAPAELGPHEDVSDATRGQALGYRHTIELLRVGRTRLTAYVDKDFDASRAE